MERFEIVSFTAKQMRDAGYCGQQGGYITGRHYAIRETGKGFVSLDGGRTVFLMKGRYGKETMQGIIDGGGFLGEVDYLESI